MSLIGSFALLLALALSAYSFLAGFVALVLDGSSSDWLGETARRAGIATFAVVALAAGALVTAAFQDNFSIEYIRQHSNRDLPIAYKFAVWSGNRVRCSSGPAAGSVWIGSADALQGGQPLVRLRFSNHFGGAVFFLLLLNFAARPFVL